MRFKSFSTPYNEIIIGTQIIQKGRRAKSTELNLPAYSINNSTGFTPQEDQWGDASYTKLSKEGYKYIERGDFAYNPARINVGSIGLYKENEPCIVSSLYVCFKTKPSIISDYLYIYLKSEKFNKKVLRTQEGGVRTYFFYDKLEKTKMYIPSLEEQVKISNFLNLLDFRIQTQNKIIEDLKIFRNLIYDKLICFYKTEQISIKELINRDFVRMIKPSELKPFIGVKKYLSTSSVDDEGISSIETLITYKDRPSRASMYPINKSVWFAKMKNTIKVLKSNNEIQNSYVLSTGFYGLLCDERKINSDWLLETFRSNSFNNQKDRFSEGSSMSAIKDNQLEDILINLITNKADEDKAVKLLLSLSSSIVTNKTLLEKHKKQKEYLLENMFI